MVLDLLGTPYETIDVPYDDRTELAVATGGYVQVPVLVTDAGRVIIDSKSICRELLAGPDGAELVPSPWEGPIWAYADWCDGPLEDVCFRLTAPGLRGLMDGIGERALFTMIKERSFGRGCIDTWEESRDARWERTSDMLSPTADTLRQQPFIFGETPTLADAALYGLAFVVRAAVPEFLPSLGEDVEAWIQRCEKVCAQRSHVAA